MSRCPRVGLEVPLLVVSPWDLVVSLGFSLPYSLCRSIIEAQVGLVHVWSRVTVTWLSGESCSAAGSLVCDLEVSQSFPWTSGSQRPPENTFRVRSLTFHQLHIFPTRDVNFPGSDTESRRACLTSCFHLSTCSQGIPATKGTLSSQYPESGSPSAPVSILLV